MRPSRLVFIASFASIANLSAAALAEYQCKAQVPGASTAAVFDVKQASPLGFSLGDFDFSVEPINISLPSAAKGIALTISGHGMKMTAVGPDDTPFLGIKSESLNVQISCKREVH